MPLRRVKSHVGQALRWSRDTGPDWVEIAAPTVGIAGSVALGAALGDLGAAQSGALGSLLVGGAAVASSAGEQTRAQLAALARTFAAATVAALLAGQGWRSDALVLALAGVAGLVAAMGRDAAVLSIRFVLTLLIAKTFFETSGPPAVLLAPMAGGVLWTSFVSLVFGAVARHGGNGQAIPARQHPSPTVRQRLARWRHALTHLSGLQFALRLVLCLAVAGFLRWLWPDHHMHWVAITVALLAEWQIDAFPIRTTQRALGTAIGVAATGLLLVYTPPVWAVIICIAALAGARPFLRARNYLAYSVVMTPLVILILDLGHTPTLGTLVDRITATLIGAALVIAVNGLFRALLNEGA